MCEDLSRELALEVALLVGRTAKLSGEVVVITDAVCAKRTLANPASRRTAKCGRILGCHNHFGRVIDSREVVFGQVEEAEDEPDRGICAGPVPAAMLLWHDVAVSSHGHIADAEGRVVVGPDEGPSASLVLGHRERFEVEVDHARCHLPLAEALELHHGFVRLGQQGSDRRPAHQLWKALHAVEVLLEGALFGSCVPRVEAVSAPAVAEGGAGSALVLHSTLVVGEPLEVCDQHVVALVVQELDLAVRRPHFGRAPPNLPRPQFGLLLLPHPLGTSFAMGAQVALPKAPNVDAEVVVLLPESDLVEGRRLVVRNVPPLEPLVQVLRLVVCRDGPSAPSVLGMDVFHPPLGVLWHLKAVVDTVPLPRQYGAAEALGVAVLDVEARFLGRNVLRQLHVPFAPKRERHAPGDGRILCHVRCQLHLHLLQFRQVHQGSLLGPLPHDLGEGLLDRTQQVPVGVVGPKRCGADSEHWVRNVVGDLLPIAVGPPGDAHHHPELAPRGHEFLHPLRDLHAPVDGEEVVAVVFRAFIRVPVRDDAAGEASAGRSELVLAERCRCRHGGKGGKRPFPTRSIGLWAVVFPLCEGRERTERIVGGARFGSSLYPRRVKAPHVTATVAARGPAPFPLGNQKIYAQIFLDAYGGGPEVGLD